MMTGAREQQLMDAADLLLDARRTTTPMEALPAALQPTTLAEAYFVQDTLAIAYEEIGGWKVGAPAADADPIFAPMPRSWIASSSSLLSKQTHRYRGVEAEIAFLLGDDLPPRATPYSREEALAAIASCHPAIEVLESGLVDPATAPRLAMIADLQMHGGFLYGPAYTGWKTLDFATETVTLSIDGVVRLERTGSNTAGDLLRLLPWLANEGATRTGGLKAGQWITTGSWTGNIQVIAGGRVDVAFTHAGMVSVRFDS